MRLEPLALDGAARVALAIHRDERGAFLEIWQARKFAAAGLDAAFVQDNWSVSRQGVLRGLHYQLVQPQGKLVLVAAGAIFAVAVDLRRRSPTFGRWLGEPLSFDRAVALWLPPGFAHGFYVTDGPASVLYKCTDFYAPAHERAIRWDDPDLAIVWPLAPGAGPILSERDRRGARFRDAASFD